jgi:cobyrinic acid a,c-diamide synthase
MKHARSVRSQAACAPRRTVARAIVVAGTHSGVGKTTVSTALMAAYRRRGLVVQSFKVGPDFIDPGYHAAATGRPGRNLDGWMLDRATVLDIFSRAASDADLAIIEGVMGLFDGASGGQQSGSTAEMAKWLNVPVVLVIDVAAMAGSAAAIVHGFETFDPELKVAAVIANNIAGEGHLKYIDDAVRAASCKAALIGGLMRDQSIKIPERHLGLFMAQETAGRSWLEKLADWVEAGLELDQLYGLTEVPYSQPPPNLEGEVRYKSDWHTRARIKVGVARDRAFCFYYQDNLELLERCGAELVYWSPISEPVPKGLRGLYFGGGYPEMNAEALAANESARGAVRRFIDAGGAVYAECGGLMYLTQAIVDTGGAEFPMAGAFPTKCRMQDRLGALGYVEVEGIGSHQMLKAGERARGHQFRYSTIDAMPEAIRRAYYMRPASSRKAAGPEGYVFNHCLASYVHLHFLSNPAIASQWLECCRTEITT